MKVPTHLLQSIRCLGIAGAIFAATAQIHADPLKIGYSDWPGYTVLEVAKQKGWFKDAGLDVELDWFDYGPSLDAFSSGKIDAVACVPTDALVIGASGTKSKAIAITDYSDGNDRVIGVPGINSIKDLKGKKVGVEVGLVDHLLLLQALKDNGMTQSDITLVNTPTNNTPQVLGSGAVSAVCAWYPISGQALTQVPGSKPLYTSASAPGLIYDVIIVNPSSLAAHKEDWAKIAGIFYKAVDYLKDPKTHDEAVKIMAAKVGANPADYAKNLPGTHFLTLAEAKKAIKKGPGLDSLYGSMVVGDAFNVENKVYKESQNVPSYIAPSIVQGLK
ncbi:MAG: ABC transporter substrate-binding protein [Terrimicrobiaceae bacterium]|nr:ABC transporter substrate-binding protein [Terrimicrobiaceae bacterium]